MLQLRRDGVCAGCSTALAAGTRAGWDSRSRRVRCLSCLPTPGPTSTPRAAATPPPGHRLADVVPALGGGRGRGARGRHPRLGGLILALTDDPTSTRVWAQGAHGERAVATALAELVEAGVVALHDRRMRRPDGRLSRANIDHIAVAASGVWVIDAKTHQGRLEVRRTGGLLSPRVERLYIAGRDQTELLEGLAGQVDAVTTALAAVRAPVPVRGALCFVGTELPWLAESIADVPLVGRRGLTKLLERPGDLTREDREALARHLDDRFPPAH